MVREVERWRGVGLESGGLSQLSQLTPINRVRYLDDERSLYYFFNTKTEESSWEAPPSYKVGE